jgi:MoaA/NifB/PqqE/SkfB family radical SAM enzyme
LLREDIFELADYATQKGLIATLGTNGTLIDDAVARRLWLRGYEKLP